MRFRVRGLLSAVAIALGLCVVVGANATPESARAELQLELADLLFGDERYWEAIPAYNQAKAGADPDQFVRASSGLLRSLISVAEFGRAHIEAMDLQNLRPADVEVRALSGDGFWAAGLFEEAEGIYRDILATDPSSPGARAGLSRSLATRGKLEQGLVEIRAALATDDMRAEFHHTLGAIYRRQNRYQEASDALQRHVDLLPSARQGERAEWARAEIRFLRSFGDRVPLELEGDPEAVHTIPFRLVNDKVVVRVKINGDGPFDLSIDTGAEQMVLSKETAQEVRVRPIANTISAGVGDVGVRGLDLGRVDVLEVGSLVMRNLPVIIKNPPLTDLPSKRELDSLSPLALGLSAVIDYRNHHLILARHLADESADIEMPMRFHRLAVVRGVVNQDHPKSFVVDTGGEVISISLGTASDLDMTPVRHIPLRVYGTSGWDGRAFLLPGVNLAFDEISYENFSVVVLNLHRPSALLGFHIGGIVGHTFLRNYRVALDIDRAVLRLTKL